MLTAAYLDELEAIGLAAGLDVLGVTTAEPLARARDALDERKRQGLHGGMQFTYRNPARSTEPRRALPSARSIIVGARSYPAGPDAAGAPQQARVAWYATRDHYADLRAGLGEVARRLEADGHEARVLADDNALVDREVAHRAGLGWFGKNANLLLPGHGSWFVLGSVLTSASLPVNDEPVADGCGGCNRCVDGCPTGAIVAPGVVDARRCLAWLVQAEGVFPRRHRVALGDRIYGCDECQLVCPINRRNGEDPSVDDRAAAWLDAVELLRADDADLLAAHGRWYIPRRDPRYLRRNALIVLGNTGDPRTPAVVETIRRHLALEDPLLQAHAVWAARRLGLDELLTDVRHAGLDPLVVAELDGEVEVGARL